MPLVETLTDDFTSIDGAKWGNSGCSIDAGRLSIGDLDSMQSAASDLTLYGSSITFQVARYPDVVNGAITAVEFVDVLGGYTELALLFTNASGSLGVSIMFGTPVAIPTPVNGDWWKLDYAGSMLRVSKSADGVTGWSVIVQTDMTAAPWDYTAGYGFVYIVERGAPTGLNALIDNFNLPPAGTPTGPKSAMWI